SEKPLVVQLFGRRPETFALAAKVISALDIDGIDINFGCPAKKVFSHGSGAALMNNLPLARQIISAVLANTALPVSVKLRASVMGVTALDFISTVKDLPLACIMVHGRSYEQKFFGPVDYAMIKKVKKAFSGVVLANGGIKTPEDAKMMLEKTGADGLGLAQGVLGKPWLFRQIKDYLKTGNYSELSLAEIKKIALKHAKLMYALKSGQASFEMRKHLAWYVKGFPGAVEIRKKLVETSNLEEIVEIMA
ncbi:MAG: tRNA-dihydrouridine synthase, partial [bacterium]